MVHLTKKQIFDAIKQSASVDSSFIDGWWICNDDNTAFLPLLQVARIVYGDKFDYVNKHEFVDAFKKTGINVRLKKIARICWNTNGWIFPSGQIGKSRNKNSYEFSYGFGYEEWLFDISKTIDGYHYGYIQAVNSYIDNEPFDVSLFTINNKTKQRYWVGEILGAERVIKKEKGAIVRKYRKRGWDSGMRKQLKGYSLTMRDGLDFNLRYKPENLCKFDILKPVDRMHPNVKATYYTSLYNLKTIFKHECHFVFQSGFRTEATEIDTRDDSSRRSHISKRHPAIQKVLYNYLVKEYGKDNVGTENPTPVGTEIDIVTKHSDEYDLYEIKTTPDIRICIREALSQLLEYGLYYTDIKVRNYYIVGSIELTAYARNYLNALRKKHHIPVGYIQVDKENRIHKYMPMDIIAEALEIRASLTDYEENHIDTDLDPIPPFKGNGRIKLVVIGQDPTITDVDERGKIKTTLKLDVAGPLRHYIERICAGLEITIENVYATNLFKYFYEKKPASTPAVLIAHLEGNLALLKKELSEYTDCIIITLGEPVLQLLTDEKHRVKYYWGYKNDELHYLEPHENKLGLRVYPFAHLPSINSPRSSFYRDRLDMYVRYVKDQHRWSQDK